MFSARRLSQRPGHWMAWIDQSLISSGILFLVAPYKQEMLTSRVWKPPSSCSRLILPHTVAADLFKTLAVFSINLEHYGRATFHTGVCTKDETQGHISRRSEPKRKISRKTHLFIGATLTFSSLLDVSWSCLFSSTGTPKTKWVSGLFVSSYSCSKNSEQPSSLHQIELLFQVQTLGWQRVLAGDTVWSSFWVGESTCKKNILTETETKRVVLVVVCKFSQRGNVYFNILPETCAVYRMRKWNETGCPWFYSDDTWQSILHLFSCCTWWVRQQMPRLRNLVFPSCVAYSWQKVQLRATLLKKLSGSGFISGLHAAELERLLFMQPCSCFASDLSRKQNLKVQRCSHWHVAWDREELPRFLLRWRWRDLMFGRNWLLMCERENSRCSLFPDNNAVRLTTQSDHLI